MSTRTLLLRIAEAYASGVWTIRTLTEALADQGPRALPRGSSLPGPPQHSHVARMLSNRYYLGLVTFRGTEYQGRHQPLVPQSLFDRVQEVLASHNRAGESGAFIINTSKGSVFCAQCGSRLCLTNAEGSYWYFFCLGRQQRRTPCPQRYLPAAAVEAAVERYYTTVRLPEHISAAIATAYAPNSTNSTAKPSRRSPGPEHGSANWSRNAGGSPEES